MNTQLPIRNEAGYLIDPEGWTPEFCSTVAAEENIELTQDIWDSVHHIRRYFELHQVAPDVRHVTRMISDARGINKQQAKKLLFEQFPYGYVKQACKISGMQQPRSWSTG